ncbi:hypothetical protein BD779DRAFT_1549951 [Infundibulicybe gibba]|nr:hypothetical protein BD779DRAFT_1549951 [Infundibulicybe gibba]
MQEAEEQDTCRICSAPAEPDQPLFYPCKCSGTIRYIHQDCLTTWLAHSKKKNCDVCKHPYSFTKVYAPDMPNRLPPILLVRRLIQQALFAILFGLRGVAVAIIWLAVLPWVTVWTWRMYFSMGESTAWWISDRPRPATQDSMPFYYNVSLDASVPASESLLARVTTHPAWLALSADIFTGQIIASLIVLTFVAVFLLREWISQNARPGIFEDEEIIDDQLAPAGEDRAQDRDQGNPERVALARQQLEAIRALDAMRARDGINGHVVGDERHLHGRTALERPLKKGKGRRGRGAASPLEPDVHVRSRRRIHSQSPDVSEGSSRDFDDERLQRRAFSRRVYAARVAGARRRALMAALATPPQPPLNQPARSWPQHTGFEFTFRASSESSRRSAWTFIAVDPPATSPQNVRFTIFVHPPSEGRRVDSTFPYIFEPGCEPGTGVLPKTRRPPLPPTASPTAGPSSATHLRERLDSPHLATYRAPEELDESGLMGANEYFDNRLNLLEEYKDAFNEDEEQELTTDLDADVGLDMDMEATMSAISDTDEEVVELGVGYRDDHPPVVEPRGDELEDEDDEDEDEDEDDGEDNEPIFGEEGRTTGALIAPPGLPEAAAAPDAGGAVPGEEPALDAAIDGNEEVAEDDMEGAMEAIGMRGPIYGVFQNAALMIFVLDTAIGLGIWIPFTIGKSTALLTLDPHRFLQILHLPIRAMRTVTDPVVDSLVFLIAEFLVPPAARTAQNIIRMLSLAALFLVRHTFGSSAENKVSEVFSHQESFFSSLLQVEKLEPYFALLGKEVRVTATRLQANWTCMALGQGPSEKAFAVILGYAVVGLFLSLYLNLWTAGNAKSASRAIRSAVRQQLLVLKVAAFIFIELVTFPLCCGIILDLCTVWLFPEANLLSRVIFFYQAPLTAMFYHWVAGTMFMYSFAILLSGCRSIMRPGAMWFIKDPQDPNSHPIRDILDRPTLTQLRKICVSGIMYSFVVACVVGSVAGLLLLGSKSIMPFRWKNREPLSNVPIDLLFLHLVLPYTMHYFRPRKALRTLATSVWKYLATRLRLTSYFFGGRHACEEYTPVKWTKNFVRPAGEIVEAEVIRDGIFRRVPAVDNIPLPRDMRATVSVTEDGEPIDEEARQLMLIQDTEAEKAKRNVKDDYRVVYIPPHFRYRVISFIALLWVIGAVFLGVSVALPIQLGRSFFKLFTQRDIHDGYSLIVGSYLLWGCYIIGKAIDRLDKRRQRRSGDGPRADLRVLVIKRGLLWVAKISYMVVFLGIVIPTLISLITNNGWTHPDPVTATKEVLGPLRLVMHIYPAIFMLVGLLRSAMVLFDLLSSWSQSIRDKEFLVEMRLRNHEPEKVDATDKGSEDAVEVGDMDGDEH